MEAAVRHLRDGAAPDATSCPACCVLDSLGVTGGTLVLQHAVRYFIAAMRQGRSQATCVRLVDLTGTLAPFAACPSSPPHQQHSGPAPDVELIDLSTDPWGWGQPSGSTSESKSGSASASLPAGGASGCSGAGPTPTLVSSSGPSGPSPAVSLQSLTAALLRPPHGLESTAAASAPEGVGQGGGATVAAAAGGGGGGGGAGRHVMVVVGCLSTLMERYGEWQALSLLEALQRSPLVSCVLTALHTDLHPPSALFGLRRLASCTLDLAPLSALQLQLAQRAVAAGAAAAGPGGGAAAGGEAAAAAQQIAGQIVCRTKRRTGRLKASSELFAVCLDDSSPTGAPGPGPGPGPLRFFPTPPALDAPDPRALLQLSRPSAGPAGPAGAEAAAGGAAAGAGAAIGGGAGAGGVAGPEEPARAVGSSMRLTLTEEERRAKQAVVLPYQHQGHARGATAAAYAAGDHEAYLPPAAGGRGPGAGRGGAGSGAAAAAVAGAGREGGGTADAPLGHILYVRDSASEADSDQDLDEDLDI